MNKRLVARFIMAQTVQLLYLGVDCLLLMSLLMHKIIFSKAQVLLCKYCGFQIESFENKIDSCSQPNYIMHA